MKGLGKGKYRIKIVGFEGYCPLEVSNRLIFTAKRSQSLGHVSAKDGNLTVQGNRSAEQVDGQFITSGLVSHNSK